jgi:hypothetical protein
MLRNDIDSVPDTAFPIGFLEEANVRIMFIVFFLKNSYGDGVIEYPQTAINEVIDPSMQPVFPATKKSTPRYSKNIFFRKIHLDANVLTQQVMDQLVASNARTNMVPMQTARLGGTIFPAIPDAGVGYGSASVPMFITVRPEGYDVINKKFDIDKLHSHVRSCTTENLYQPSVMVVVYIRGYLKYLAEKSIEGRLFSATGNTAESMEYIGNISIGANYRVRNLFYDPMFQRLKDDTFRTCMKNYGKTFQVDFSKKIKNDIQWNNTTYFEEWEKALRGSPKYYNLLRACTNDLDKIKLGQLILFSRNHELQAAPTELHVFIPMQKIRMIGQSDHAELLNNQLNSCYNEYAWKKCLVYVRNHGVLSDKFMECLMKTRIKWCYEIKRLISVHESEHMASQIVSGIDHLYYHKNDNIDHVLFLGSQDEVHSQNFPIFEE